MEYLLILVLGAIVIWLVRKRGIDQQHIVQLSDLASRLEGRVLPFTR
jgi:hypothetical protein